MTKSKSVRVCSHCGSILPPKGEDAADITPRQREVLRLLAGGMTSQEIANQLGISRRTAEFHRAMLMQRLNVGSTAELALRAAAYHLVT
jgi:Response regulator containing a CheY-like receiver domain and an HTH DNA-binding domain